MECYENFRRVLKAQLMLHIVHHHKHGPLQKKVMTLARISKALYRAHVCRGVSNMRTKKRHVSRSIAVNATPRGATEFENKFPFPPVASAPKIKLNPCTKQFPTLSLSNHYFTLPRQVLCITQKRTLTLTPITSFS